MSKAYAGNSYSRAPQVTLSSLASLVSSLKQQQEMQSTEIGRIKNRIQSLEKENEDLRAENSDLWNEINKIKGPRFPPELFDRFIDFLHHDKQALKACSLVCRTWIPASRFHLLGCITVRPVSPSFYSMGELLDSSFCTLFKSVRKITIDGNTDIGHPDGPMRGIRPYWLEPLAGYLNRFTSVTTLHLICMSTTSMRFIIGSPGFTSRITNLLLHRFICSTFNDFPYFLSYFSKLESLSCDVHFCDISTDSCTDCEMVFMADKYAETLAIDDSLCPPPATLQVILNDIYSLHNCYSASKSAWCNWLRTSGHTYLRTMSFENLSHEPNKDEIIALSAYLRVSGAALKHIRIGFATEEAVDIFFDEYKALSRCTCLETLHITSGIWSYDTTHKTFHRFLTRLPNLLLSLPTASMKKVIFDISTLWSPHPNPLPKSYDFSAIDCLLDRFSVLEELTFRVDSMQGALVHVLESKLPKCKNRGILKMYR